MSKILRACFSIGALLTTHSYALGSQDPLASWAADPRGDIVYQKAGLFASDPAALLVLGSSLIALGILIKRLKR